MRYRSHLYLWTILPPALIDALISEIRIGFSRKYQCFAALKPPVHLTLHTLFKSPHHISPEQIRQWQEWFKAQPAIWLQLKNYGFFENPSHPVVFIDVLQNALLRELHKGIGRLTGKLPVSERRVKPSFRPHFTIGYRDILPASFLVIRRHYSRLTFDASFKASEVCLLRHNSVRWELYERFPLGINYAVQGSLFPNN